MSRNVWNGQIPALETRTSIRLNALTASVTICGGGVEGLALYGRIGRVRTCCCGCCRVTNIPGDQDRTPAIPFYSLLHLLNILQRALSQVVQHDVCSVSRCRWLIPIQSVNPHSFWKRCGYSPIAVARPIPDDDPVTTTSLLSSSVDMVNS